MGIWTLLHLYKKVKIYLINNINVNSMKKKISTKKFVTRFLTNRHATLDSAEGFDDRYFS